MSSSLRSLGDYCGLEFVLLTRLRHHSFHPGQLRRDLRFKPGNRRRISVHQNDRLRRYFPNIVKEQVPGRMGAEVEFRDVTDQLVAWRCPVELNQLALLG